MTKLVTYETRGHVGVITLNRPEARNAVNDALAADMESAIDQLEADNDVRVGVLTANTQGHASPVFSAGADLKALNAGGQTLGTKRGGFAGFVYRERTKPVIAAVDGLATAGGCEIVLACDMVIASDRSAFGLAEVKRNLIAGAGGLFRLPRAIGTRVAMEVILTGEPLSVHRAHQLGLVNHVVAPDQALAAALELAEKISTSAPLAVAASRRVVLASVHASDAELKKLTDEEFAPILRSEDTKEGLMAFIEKRPPQWKNR